MVGGLVLLWQEQEKLSGRQGLRAGAELSLTVEDRVAGEEKMLGRQGLKAGGE